MTATPNRSRPDSVEGCLDACRRCEAVVDLAVAHDGGRPGHAWRAVAPHLRHCVEHFLLLLAGLAAGVVDYDARARDAALEREPAAMRAALTRIAAELSGLDAGSVARTVLVRQSAASGRPPSASPSCLDRELVFLSGHTIHHIAIMALAAQPAGVTIPPGLAVAFSTEAHRDLSVVG